MCKYSVQNQILMIIGTGELFSSEQTIEIQFIDDIG